MTAGSAIRGILRQAAKALAADTRKWGLTLSQALLIACFPVLVTVAFVAAAPRPRLFMWLVDEDAVLETMQFVLILSATVVFGWLTARLLRRRHPLAVLYLLVSAAMFFVAGEEISWGQRIFGLRTPEALEVINTQQEISLHNIQGMHQPFIYAVMAGGLIGALLPLVALAIPARYRGSRSALLLIPPLCLVPVFLTPFAYRFTRLVVQPEQYVAPGYGVFVITEYSEVTELCLYFAFLVFGWLNLRGWRAADDGT